MDRIGIISDTHGLLRPEVTEELQGCAAILHGGDVHRPELLDELEKLAPVYAVRGNNDRDWPNPLPPVLRVTAAGIRFLLIHDQREISHRMAAADADVVVFGHSHRYEERREEGRLWLNPGSCGPRRFRLPVTMAVLEAEEGRIMRVRRIEIEGNRRPQGTGERGKKGTPVIPPDIRRRIPGVTRDMDRGRPLWEIAERAGISYELAEQICRIYVTHPGVDVEGIMRRLGL